MNPHVKTVSLQKMYRKKRFPTLVIPPYGVDTGYLRSKPKTSFSSG